MAKALKTFGSSPYWPAKRSIREFISSELKVGCGMGVGVGVGVGEGFLLGLAVGVGLGIGLGLGDKLGEGNGVGDSCVFSARTSGFFTVEFLTA